MSKKRKIEQGMTAYWLFNKELIECTVVEKHRHTAEIMTASGQYYGGIQIGSLYAECDKELAFEKMK